MGTVRGTMGGGRIAAIKPDSIAAFKKYGTTFMMALPKADSILEATIWGHLHTNQAAPKGDT
jgi:hypothetical protein